MEGLERLNGLPPGEAREELMKCCGSSAWAEAVAGGRPYRDLHHLLEVADKTWYNLAPSDWLEAFGRHRKIGETEASQPAGGKSAGTGGWSAQEQSGVGGASKEVLNALAEGNRSYEEKFGYIFIVCATGKSAPQMLEILGRRLPNGPQEELRVAAGEQAKITRLRLWKLLAP